MTKKKSPDAAVQSLDPLANTKPTPGCKVCSALYKQWKAFSNPYSPDYDPVEGDGQGRRDAQALPRGGEVTRTSRVAPCPLLEAGAGA
ncbi:hypothetical protein GCM10020295_14520 [Streptomyces cinereospinus]